jgi:hypothetical protein
MLQFRYGWLLFSTATVAAVLATACVRERAPDPCATPRLAAAERIAALASGDVLIVGETHGTTEIPPIFGSVVCAVAGRHAGRVIVGLELSPDALDSARVAAGEDSVDTRRATLDASPFWHNARDGRTSEAMFRLVRHLVALEEAGEIVLVGFDHRITGTEPFAQLAFAGIAAEAARQRDGHGDRFVLLTGNGHAQFGTDPASLGTPFADGGYRVDVVGLDHDAGTAWVCSRGSCGPRPAGGFQGCRSDLAPRLAERTVHTLCIGDVTPSPPQLGGAEG